MRRHTEAKEVRIRSFVRRGGNRVVDITVVGRVVNGENKVSKSNFFVTVVGKLYRNRYIGNNEVV
jgi:hypothetical protein